MSSEKKVQNDWIDFELSYIESERFEIVQGNKRVLFQRMSNDGKWYAVYENEIISCDKDREMLKECVRVFLFNGDSGEEIQTIRYDKRYPKIDTKNYREDIIERWREVGLIPPEMFANND